jgi:hypothetical protein
MKILRIRISLVILCTLFLTTSSVEKSFGRTFFTARSVGSNSDRELAGWAHQVNLTDMCSFYGTLAITPGYQATIHTALTGEYLFFNGFNTMQFAPVIVSTDPTPVFVFADVDPINFLLNPDFNGTIRSFPTVSNTFVDFNFYLGLDGFTPGLYIRAHTPFVHTRYSVGLSDEIRTNIGTTIPANLLGNPTDTPAPVNSIIEAWTGNATFFDVKAPMSFARSDGAKTKNSLADIEMALGYNWLRCDDAHLGINLRAIVPISHTSPKSQFFFEPVCGNGHHIELGFGVTGHLDLWRCGCEQTLGIYIDANFYHMLKAKQRRTFDLKTNGIGSRYLLFKRFDGATNTYLGEIVRGPNILTVNCNVGIDFHADATIMLDYCYNTFSFDIGYNLWGITKEKITIHDTIPEKTFGIAGNSGTSTIDPDTGRNRTASTTRITGEGSNALDGNSPADNIYIDITYLDPRSARHPSAVSQKLFMHASYIWDYCHVDPYLGAGFEAEFSAFSNKALNLWSVWVKGGFFFS